MKYDTREHLVMLLYIHKYQGSGVVRPQRSPTALGYGQTPTPTPKENVGVTIDTYPSKHAQLMLIIRYFCKVDQVERAYLC